MFLLETFKMYLMMSLLYEKNLNMLPKINTALPFNRQYFSNVAQGTIRYWCCNAR